MTATNLPSGPPSTEEKNVLGIVGFVTSILGLLTCGVLAPIGFVLSLLAITKRPKGFALAGTVIGLLGCLLLLFWGLTFVRTVLGFKAAAEGALASTATFVTLVQSRD